MSSVVKFSLLALSLAFANIACANTAYVLVVSDGSKACNVVRESGIKSVFQMNGDGMLLPATDSLRGTGCAAGRIWVRLGDKIVRSGAASKVVFVPVNPAQVIVGDKQSEKLTSGRGDFVNVKSLKNVRFDYGLWQLNNAVGAVGLSEYSTDLRKIIRYFSLNAKVEKWVLGQSANAKKDVATVQMNLANNPGLNRFVGPEIALGDTSWADGLSEYEYRKLSGIWATTLQKADRDSVRLQKESLQFYFK